MRIHPISLALALALTLIAPVGCSGDDTPATPATPAPPTLADLEIPNATIPFPDVLVGGQPTVAQLESAAAVGVRTIVNLRPEKELGIYDTSGRAEAAIVEHLGMRYVLIPVQGGADLNEENARRLAEALEAPDALPAMVHCASGNRVGALFALKAAWLDGASAEAALELGLGAGMTRLEGAIREKLGAEPADP